jgi:sulfoxide reductase heme-binding subunit YedZ
MNRFNVLRYFVFIAGFIPFLLLVQRTITNHLGANPVEKITHFTGDWTLKFILITLSVSPLQKIFILLFKWPWPQYTRIRRILGLYAFFYACLHFLTYLTLDRFFDFTDITKDIAKRPYITIGFAAFLMLVPLAMTSTISMQRKLGKNWKRLHRLIYLIAVFGVLHYYWLVKADRRWPIIYGLILLGLLIFRILHKLGQNFPFAACLHRVKWRGSNER